MRSARDDDFRSRRHRAPRGAVELVEYALVRGGIDEGLPVVRQMRDVHRLDRGQARGESVELYFLAEGDRELGIGRDERESAPHHARDVGGGFEEAQDRDIENLARFDERGIGGIERHEGVVPIRAFRLSAPQDVLDDVRCVDRLEEPELLSEPALARPVNVDPDVRIHKRAQVRFERFVIIRVSLARRKYLHPDAHAFLLRSPLA